MADPGRSGSANRLALLGLAVGVTATVVAWGYLVLAAIDFGRDARAGSGEGWLFMSGATVGAVACLFLAIIFGSRLVAAVRGTPTQPALAPSRSEPVVTAPGGVRPGDVVALDDEELPAADPPAPYRSRHSSASVDPDRADTEDAPAAAYKGKRAAR